MSVSKELVSNGEGTLASTKSVTVGESGGRGISASGYRCSIVTESCNSLSSMLGNACGSAAATFPETSVSVDSSGCGDWDNGGDNCC
jgi:hypothetical protein